MSNHLPPVPPAGRPTKGPAAHDPGAKSDPNQKSDHTQNIAEQGDTANIKQNTTNKGFFAGRRVK